MDDLITRLTAAIDEEERIAGALPADGYPKHGNRVLSVDGTGVSWPDRWNPTRVLRGCAADRKLLALHQPLETFAGLSVDETWKPRPGQHAVVICAHCANEDRESGWDEYDEDTQFPCLTLRITAERYDVQP